MTQDLFGVPDPATHPDRIAWRKLVEQTLPALAATRNWPIHLDHCFARVLLDNAVGKPWRDAIPAPAWKNAPIETLKKAIAMGEAAINGTQNLSTLNTRSLELRGKRTRQ